DVSDHVFELYSKNMEKRQNNLGFVSSNEKDLKDEILQKMEFSFEIKQSLTNLSSNTDSSTTGYVMWQLTPFFLKWLLYSKHPFHDLIFEHYHEYRRNNKKELVIVELGSGISGISATILLNFCDRYIATDQHNLLKLMRENIISNCHLNSINFNSKTIGHQKNNQSHNHVTIESIEFDWEEPLDGIYELNEVMALEQETSYSSLIIACDTIYNEYLMEHFINAMAAIHRNNDERKVVDVGALVAMQLRDNCIVQMFLERLLEAQFDVFHLPEELLSDELQNGFSIY
ncbi:S-adenosylmethionine-dependent methyltransferase ASCRUDRAFT_26514, partial [Ascoidea rubescens DSM 1968]